MEERQRERERGRQKGSWQDEARGSCSVACCTFIDLWDAASQNEIKIQ